VLDGHILAWSNKGHSHPDISSAGWQETAASKVLRQIPVVFMAYDLLNWPEPTAASAHCGIDASR